MGIVEQLWHERSDLLESLCIEKQNKKVATKF